MMEENFKRIADAVRLPEGSRARIRAQIASRAEEQEASMQNKPKKHLPRLAVAAIIIAAALTLTAAAAAVVHRFRNDIIVSSVSELPAPTEDTPTAVAVVTDSQSAAQTLDEILAEGPYITAEEWETGEKSVVRHPLSMVAGIPRSSSAVTRCFPSAGSHARQTAQRKCSTWRRILPIFCPC